MGHKIEKWNEEEQENMLGFQQNNLKNITWERSLPLQMKENGDAEILEEEGRG